MLDKSEYSIKAYNENPEKIIDNPQSTITFVDIQMSNNETINIMAEIWDDGVLILRNIYNVGDNFCDHSDHYPSILIPDDDRKWAGNILHLEHLGQPNNDYEPLKITDQHVKTTKF